MRHGHLLALTLVGCASVDKGFGVPEHYELVYCQDFATRGAMVDFHFTDPDAWDWHMDPQDASVVSWLEAEGGSDYSPPYRSPLNIALLRGIEVRDFVLEVDVLNTAPESRGSHRDLCFFFGFQDPANFYYVHLAPVHLRNPPAPDANAHNVFLVDDAARRNLATAAVQGIDWGDDWHHVRIERSLSDGSIRVFFDDMQAPVIETTDTTHGWGRVGLGTFDDSGRFSNLFVFAPTEQVVEHQDPFR